MFDFIRTHRKWMQLILLVLIVPAFAFFGIEGYMGFMSSEKEVAVVDGNAITLPEFDAARRNQLDQLRRNMGDEFDAQAIDTPEFREQLLNELINQRVIITTAIEGRYTVSDETLRQTIAEVPALQTDGRFSAELYRQVLASQGMTPADFEAQLRSDLILSQVLDPIGESAHVPTEVFDHLVHQLTQQRKIALRHFDRQAYLDQIDITDDEVKTWHDKHAEELRLPPSVDIEYVVIDEPTATRGVNITDDEIKAFYDQNQSRYGQPERRRVSHILYTFAEGDEGARNQARERAQEVSDELRADPERFGDLAREESADPGSANDGGDLGWIGKDMLEPEVEKAVFSLEPDTISDAIESPFGFHVIKVTGIQEATTKPLEQVREDIESQLRTQLASARFADLAGQLTTLVYDMPDSLDVIAEQLDLPLQSAQGITREGLLSDRMAKRDKPLDADEKTLLEHPRIRQTAFSEDVMKTGQNSGALELAPDTIVALRVTKAHEAFVPDLEMATPLIRDELRDTAALKLAQEEGSQALASAQQDAANAGFGPATVISRQDTQGLANRLINAIMNEPDDNIPTVIGMEVGDGYTLVDIQSVEPNLEVPAEQLEQIKRDFSRALGAAEEAGALAQLRAKYDAKITPEGRAVIEGSDDD